MERWLSYRESTNQRFHQITVKSNKEHVDHPSTIVVCSKEEENACSIMLYIDDGKCCGHVYSVTHPLQPITYTCHT